MSDFTDSDGATIPVTPPSAGNTIQPIHDPAASGEHLAAAEMPVTGSTANEPTASGGPPPQQPGGSGYGGSGYGGSGPGNIPPGHGPFGPAYGWGWPPPPGAVPASRERRRALRIAAPAFAAAMVLAGVGIGDAVWGSSSSGSTPSVSRFRTSGSSSTSSTGASAEGAPSNIATIAAGVDPGLVDINTVLGYQTGQAAGTGIVLTSTGKVLTNNHVVEGSTSISVTDIGNNQTYSATVIGYDITTDVAVIQLQDASGLTKATIGNSTNVSVGESVVGIGNAGGTGGIPSTAGGSVTALDQSITASDEGTGTTEHLTGLIESNADIQPGDSGGPLVNTAGQVIGMDTAASENQGFTFRGAATGQAYSIPIDTAMSIATKIESSTSSTSSIHNGKTAFLGVEVETAATAASSGSGAYVARVVSGTPAQSAGLSTGDLITSLGGSMVTSPEALSRAIDQYKPGMTVTVVWTTPTGQSQSATVTLTSGPVG